MSDQRLPLVGEATVTNVKWGQLSTHFPPYIICGVLQIS